MLYIDFNYKSWLLRYWEIVIYYYLILAKVYAINIAIEKHYIAQLHHKFIAKTLLCL